MNTLATLTVLATYGALGYVLVRNELLLRLHRKQIIKLIAAHNNLRERFGRFMLNGGQDVMKKNFEEAWDKSGCLKPDPNPVAAGKPPPLLPLEDVDTISALPPFVQASKWWRKN